ncbi:SDR family NAD(P)-dependent oxidoreductase [Paraburkholderia humisilvae]|uniref:SDR family NAD(P)-dependent oxidoreductase n=1 Tax=Paraburkholderia humisilvae TaxID=627669 RepID=UPI0036714F79
MKSLTIGLIADTASAQTDVDITTPFGEIGVDSFRILKMIKQLEEDFGTLPKTLLFEYFNIETLAGYFVDRHRTVVAAKFGAPADAAPTSHRAPGDAPARPSPVPQASAARDMPVTAAGDSIRMLGKDLPAFPQLHAQIESLFVAHRNEGSMSRGTRNIAPNLFIGSARRGYFHYGRCKDLVLGYAYTGPSGYFHEIAAELHHYCESRGYQLNILTDEVVEEIGGARFSSTPFGVVQRVLGIRAFSLEGGAMRRLRYQVSKFEKAGTCRTAEYRCGTEPGVDRDIASVIERWCATRPMVNPLIPIVKDEILAGSLDPQHRLFLTYLDDVLQNVILISAIRTADCNGYLMDLEFYPPDMPLGGLEYAIVNIIRTLAGEGNDVLSLGGTYGCRLTVCENADPDVDRMLDDLHRQNIFNDEGNLQFKNKFRPENRTIYLCRPAGSGRADNVIDIILMVADPDRLQTPDGENHTLVAGQQPAAGAAVAGSAQGSQPQDGGGEAHVYGAASQAWVEGDTRSRVLAEHGYNPLNVAAAHIEFDLKTDSWAQLDTAFVRRGIKQLHAQLQAPVDVDAVLRDTFGFDHVLLTGSGRAAESLLCGAWPKRGRVLQNLLFPSGLYHQIDAGLSPHELPHPDAFRVDADTPFKAELDPSALAEQIERHADEIGCVWIELCNNATGGHPVSLEHLRAVKALLAPHRIALVIDATRVLENARYLIARDGAQAGKDLWTVARELLACADVVTASLAKDFGVDRGGVIATNDGALYAAFAGRQQHDGGGLDAIGRQLVGVALGERERIAGRVAQRVRAVGRVWDALVARGVPLVAPAGGHCVLIDVKRLPDFAGFDHPVASFLAWLYQQTGIRGGAHSIGMRKDGPLGGMARLAIPAGLKDGEVDELITRLTRGFDTLSDIPELALEGSRHDALGNLHAAYRMIRYHRASKALVTGGADASPNTASARTAVSATARLPSRDVAARAQASSAPRAIAIVGMAGRYPKAATLDQFWDNLRAGRDCVDEIGAERLALRARTPFMRTYRGGFIDAIDRFDSLFFNISPREAEMLDPQERLFLEVAWEALEDAGYYPEILGRDTGTRDVGVFVGAVWAMYQMAGVEAKLAGRDTNPNSFLWSIANRVSYWMNLRGPSLTVDTACSSSLTALYLACEAIRNGNCSSALVGGVNLDLHQHKFDINRAGGALSPDGVCRTFGADANGYVAGEGVGALYLKPLDDALRDGDHVYGVVRGVVVNHGGRTAGYTVPNPKAQGDLIAAALQRADVTADTIGYIEAHGTGTELGDPIEIAGLSNAFASAAVPARSCPIGSVKTNIGHLEAAAGVVGVTKVLLQMRHGELVPSLHSAQLNAHIDFAGTPFEVQQTLAPWRPRRAGEPLRAGVSSFGAGGANAHVVLEQYLPYEEQGTPVTGELAFPLSAHNDEQLREMAARLSARLRRDDHAPRIADVAYTLQNGRKSFDHRLVIFATDLVQLADRLAAFATGKPGAETLTGHAKDAEQITKLLSRTETDQFVALMSQGGNQRKLAQLWLNGLLADCRGFMREGRRTPLPPYPFADRRHWVERAARPTAFAPPVLHPLLDSNESTFERQLFRKTFRPREFVVRDHVVSGVPTLPGTAYLELARKAAELAAGRPVRRIRNVTWLSPLTVANDSVTEAFVELKPNGETVAFEVYSEPDGVRRLHAQGRLIYELAYRAADMNVDAVDLAAVRERCAPLSDGAPASIYARFDQAGMHYGTQFQALSEVRKGDGEVLGRLQLPPLDEADFESFVLHPVLLDAAMQAGIAAQLDGGAGEMRVPYSLGEVEILHPLTRDCYSYVTKRGGSRGGVSREDVAIVDGSGKVLVRIHETVGVPITGMHDRQTAAPAEHGDTFAMLHYTRAWRPETLDAAAGRDALVLFDTDTKLRDACVRQGRAAALVLHGTRFESHGDGAYTIDAANADDYARVLEALRADGWSLQRICHACGDRVDNATDDLGAAPEAALDLGVYTFLPLSRAWAATRPADGAQLVYLYRNASRDPQPHHEAINGFARCVELEQPRLACKVLEIRTVSLDADRADVSARALLAEFDAGAQASRAVRYGPEGREVRTLRRLPEQELRAEAGPMLRQGGVYLITGGAGGLGLLFAAHLAKTCHARLVLTGRSAPSGKLDAELDALRAHGAQVLYVQADVARVDDARRAVDACRTRFGRIDGVLHCAGVLRDSLLRNKTREEMAAVFAPKILGVHHLDELTRDDALDCFVLFSSLAAVGGNVGQCDYAYANHYLDSFAARRDALRAAGRRNGRSLSINWSLWAEGGMKLDAQTERVFRRNLGIAPLRSEDGLAAFTAGLSAAVPQLAVLSGVQTKVERAWGLTQSDAQRPKSSASAIGGAAKQPEAAGDGPGAASRGEAPQTDALFHAIVRKLSGTVLELLKLDADDLSRDSVLLDVGFDSIGLSTFADAINRIYGLDLNPVLFFEYPSINAIAGVLASEHATAARAVHGASEASSTVRAPAPSAPAAAVARDETRAPLPDGIDKGWRAPGAAPAPRRPSGSRFAADPIAIVGIAGIMPQSSDVHEYWTNLRDARDLVTEIPRERWIWEDVAGDPVKDVNRSYSRWGGFMKEVDKFDPLFFGITPREAEMMDPQQRLLIQTVWSAIEDAGHRVSDLAGTRTGLFVGASSQDYIDVLAQHQSALDGYSASGNAHSILANRISFLFNLRGPSAPLDTACSSSLVALHRAIESIHTGSSEMAIVAGVQVMLTPTGHISLSAAGMLSPDGKCKTFTKGADGYVRGEGVGAIFIKRLSQARNDGNPVYAVIRATAENHGGRVTNLTAPNPKAQTELLLEAYEHARIDPSTVGYIECHGTGTSLGDPIEIQALKKSFADLYARHGLAAPPVPHCGLSSVKTNIGHLEPAAGIASLLKVLLAIRHRQIPAMLHFDMPNPYIDLSGSPFYVVDKTTPWDAPRAPDGEPLPRRAGVSAFGWGGANAHVVLEEYVDDPVPSHDEDEQLFVLSARDGERLREYAGALAAYLRTYDDVALGDLAWTLQVGRDEMDERLAIVARTHGELLGCLSAFAAGETEVGGCWSARVPRRRAMEDADPVRFADASVALAELARGWTGGRRIDWRQLHSAQRRRLSVPTYPFARERYWVGDATQNDRTGPAAATTVSPQATGADVGAVLAEPVWTDAAAALRPDTPLQAPKLYEAVLCDLSHLDAERLRAELPGLAHVARPAAGADHAERYRIAALAVFERIQHVLKTKPSAPVLLQIVAPYDDERNPLYAGLAGLVRSARVEQPNLIAQLVLVDEAADEAALAQRLRDCRTVPGEAVFRYERAQASVARWRDVAGELARSGVPIALRECGVYLIVGGLGGLGLIFAREILRQVPHATVVLTGRGALTDTRRDRLHALAAEWSVPAERLDYRELDLERLDSVRECIDAIVARHGALHGVLHGAGTTNDSLIVKKDAESFAQVLAPKVAGTFHLDVATRELDLDFVVLFSSLSAALGNVGQADYAAANGFMDAYARMRNALARAGERRGHTLSVNWPLWDEGGMRLDAKARARLFASTGLLPMRTDTGVHVWHRALSAQLGQLLVMEGQTARLRRIVPGLSEVAPRGARPVDTQGQPATDAGQLLARLRQRVLVDLHGFQKLGVTDVE